MIVVFVSIILVLTRVFGSAQAQSAEAKQLTAAVTLAQSTAEAVSVSKSPQDLLDLLGEDGNALLQEDGATGQALVTAVYDADMNPVALPRELMQAAEGSASQEAGDGADSAATDFDGTGAAGAAGEDAVEGGISAESLLQRGDLIVETAWNPAADAGADGQVSSGTDAGKMVDAVITVFNGNSGEPLFSLNTSVYLPGRQ